MTEVVPGNDLRAKATDTARKLAAKPAAALQASKRLMKQPFREQLRAAMKAENEEPSAQVRSDDAREGFTAFVEKRKLDFRGNPMNVGVLVGGLRKVPLNGMETLRSQGQHT